MFLTVKKVQTQFKRLSKLKKEHTYFKSKTVAIFCCDNCQTQFERELGSIDKKRLDNQYFHVCSQCNSKKFAQEKSVESRKFWNISVDSDLDISKI